ncbi:hypothetical protein F1B92_02700 [Campylobacter sp. FMV-PI01]|uniref:RNA-binding protein KhpB N-terminal domain-containing protein n=1 Tax=Campylobacter portucalensis TaxID=2608384 RepID=A0A6L5WJT6_9BACT|nr:Jag N-terminal domain-containing protein [Campylobacter portucalensis]MSN96113.1 hypothetical protein [Campylobacter portucalensis]
MKIIAKTLEEAYLKASRELNRSVVELNIKVIQNPKNGFLGFFKKDAIIEILDLPNLSPNKQENQAKKEISISQKVKNKSNSKKSELKIENFSNILYQVETGLKNLLASNFFEIDIVEISKFNSDTIYIKLDGKDSALLIGKEGHRYKAFLCLLHNWISIKYGLNIRLEIAEFLKNQENMIKNYLNDYIIPRVKEHSRAQTKLLDGILINIALEQLKAEFPNKYIGVKSSKNGKFIVIKECKKND